MFFYLSPITVSTAVARLVEAERVVSSAGVRRVASAWIIASAIAVSAVKIASSVGQQLTPRTPASARGGMSRPGATRYPS